ncbi:Pyridoxine/pyridoxamine 5'-phosphate oxidase [Streptomyces fumanus]
MVAAGQREPHTVTLVMADAEGLPDARIVMLHGADADGWSFAGHAGSRKGRQLAARPYAALVFHWPVLGRQVRVRGPVAVAPPEAARADLRARSTGALAAALTGRQSEPLGSPAELARASAAAWDRAAADPDTPAPTWTWYRLRPGRGGVLPGRPPAPARPAWSTDGPGRASGTRGCCGRERSEGRFLGGHRGARDRDGQGVGSGSVARRAWRWTSRNRSWRPASNIAPRRVPS